MNRIIILITLLINFTSCNSQDRKKISNFDKLNKIQVQIENHSTNEKTYQSLDSLKKVVDGADAELYLETYKNAIIYDTDRLLNYLNLNHKKIDENVIAFFEQDEKTFKIINEKLKRIKKNKSSFSPNLINGKWKKDCNEISPWIDVNENKVKLCVNFNQITIETSISKKDLKYYELRLIKPIDLGRGGMELEWRNYAKDSIIAIIRVVDKTNLNIKWLGFYNLKSKSREWESESDFSSNSKNGMKLNKCLQKGVINDSDGYTNLRKNKNKNSEIIQKINTNEEVEILDISGDWNFVQTKDGKKGFVHKSRVVLE